jgi:hypothetical protein
MIRNDGVWGYRSVIDVAWLSRPIKEGKSKILVSKRSNNATMALIDAMM